MDKLRENVELGAAKGGMIFKPYIDGDGIAIDFVQADQFFPVRFDANQKITAVVFIERKAVGKFIYTRIEYHNTGLFSDERGVLVDGYQIVNKAFRSEDSETLGVAVELTEVAEWAELAEVGVIKNVKKPLFGYYRYPSANNIDSSSPLGVSCYARAAQVGNNKKSLIQQADEHWSNLLWEFESGKRALYLDVLAFGKSTSGEPYLPNKRLYRTLNGTAGVGSEEFFEEWSPTFREASLLNGFEAILRKVEYNCGLAYGIISNPVTVDKTATEFKITQQNFFRTIKDNQKSLQEALEELIYAMDVWATVGKLAPKGTYATAFEFDDSVIVDSAAQFQQDLLVLDRVLSRVEFRVRNYGETEEIAKKNIALIDAERQPTDLFPTTE
jgi:A118 family predicted phage portal protein